jgi:hypothetical protein
MTGFRQKENKMSHLVDNLESIPSSSDISPTQIGYIRSIARGYWELRDEVQELKNEITELRETLNVAKNYLEEYEFYLKEYSDGEYSLSETMLFEFLAKLNE